MYSHCNDKFPHSFFLKDLPQKKTRACILSLNTTMFIYPPYPVNSFIHITHLIQLHAMVSGSRALNWVNSSISKWAIFVAWQIFIKCDVAKYHRTESRSVIFQKFICLIPFNHLSDQRFQQFPNIENFFVELIETSWKPCCTVAKSI